MDDAAVASRIELSRMAEGDGVILHTTVTTGYDVPWRRVHELLLEAAAAREGACKTPAPFVLQTSLDDFYVSYEPNLYSNEPGSMALIYAEIHQNIQDAFRWRLSSITRCGVMSGRPAN